MKENSDLNKIKGTIWICVILLAIASQCFGYTPTVYDPTPNDWETSYFAIGTCGAGVFFIQPPGTTWTTSKEEEATNIVEGAFEKFEEEVENWIEFVPMYWLRVSTSYNESYIGVHDELWVAEVMNSLGFTGSNYVDQMCKCCKFIRNETKCDWAVIIFMVDMTHTSDHRFGNGVTAYAALQGPYTVIAYYYGGGRLTLVHELGHVFGATHCGDGKSERSGYLYAYDNETTDHKCIMNMRGGNFCQATKEQMGLRDLDGDHIPDPIDNENQITLNPHPDTTDRILHYTGITSVVPYPTSNPIMRDVTITKISIVEFRVDGGGWYNASPTDGAFDSQVEEFFFTTPPLDPGEHVVEVRSFNSVGNTDEETAVDTVLIIEDGDVPPPTASFTYWTTTENITVGTPVIFDASSSTSPNSSIHSYSWEFGDGNKTLTYHPIISHVYGLPGNYTVLLNVTNAHGMWDVATASIRVWPSINSVDINGDGIVNILDIAIVAKAYATTPGDPNWNPIADIAEPYGEINILDIVTVAREYGNSKTSGGGLNQTPYFLSAPSSSTHKIFEQLYHDIGMLKL